MTTNDTKSCLIYLNILVDQCNNTFHHSIGKKTINANYFASTEQIETNQFLDKLRKLRQDKSNPSSLV